ncbi:hypothetical protein [Bacillus multifaciens]|uniref:hypothetical protein n=1 Tax=Bacillus multifaciens TaxID=3068506 RepID=UPI0027407E6F|nr:hypothetical protein [Bacillus sp. WLY-B-L8]MDP7980341.1 hypothetical protein [Bacillus sp. WLY-B-L8]
MSRATDLFEQRIADCATLETKIPTHLPDWMNELGIVPNSTIISSNRIGSKDRNNKTDVLIQLSDSVNLKISAKLSSADYFGNWYGHLRFLEEFGEETFDRLSHTITEWANWWITQSNASPFVGVSICFGRRSGNTAIRFLDIFTPEDVISVVRGYGEETDATANCMYISNTPPNSIDDLVHNLRPINHETISQAVGEFMIACRPINPMTEGTNRGKNVYTEFKPFHPLNSLTTITSAQELSKLGEFIPVKPNRLNHNHILNSLQSDFNIVIPRKK